MISLASDVWASATWGLLGLICGYVLGRMGVQVAESKSRPLIGNNLLGAIVVVLAIITVTGLSISTNRAEDQINCQTEFNQQFVTALQERVDAGARERQAQRELLTSKATTRPEREKVLRTYLQRLDEADQAREQNPYPVPANCDKQ